MKFKNTQCRPTQPPNTKKLEDVVDRAIYSKENDTEGVTALEIAEYIVEHWGDCIDLP